MTNTPALFDHNVGIVTLTGLTVKNSQTIMTEACNFNGLANAWIAEMNLYLINVKPPCYGPFLDRVSGTGGRMFNA